MILKYRPDGTYIKQKGFFRLMPYIMPTRSESTIFFEQEIDITNSLALIERLNQESNHKITFFHVYMASCIRTIVNRPKLNRFVNNYRYFQRNNISMNFVAKKELTDEAEEINVTMKFSPYDTLLEVSEKIHNEVYKAKSPKGNVNQRDVDLLSKIPHPILKFTMGLLKFCNKYNIIPKAMVENLPFFTTAFIANIGSIGIDAPFHHNFELGTIGLFIAIGKIRDKEVKLADGSYQNRKVVTVNYTHDDRVVDGVYCAKALKMIKDDIQNPEKLLEKIELTDKQLEYLKLKDFPPKSKSKKKKSEKK
ncbi:MAG: 2-oxo acid dehydrogenase subunit E2 [Spirochaetales bacterium]|nr:2-oxo acid dehydrogenase subunit E2 [Spirochaetales bacterium]